MQLQAAKETVPGGDLSSAPFVTSQRAYFHNGVGIKGWIFLFV